MKLPEERWLFLISLLFCSSVYLRNFDLRYGSDRKSSLGIVELGKDKRGEG